MMTDKELLDGLQQLFDRPGVVALRSCRSGVKIDIAIGDLSWADETEAGPSSQHRDYFGSGAEWPAGQVYDKLGPNIRVAIERAIIGERAPT